MRFWPPHTRQARKDSRSMTQKFASIERIEESIDRETPRLTLRVDLVGIGELIILSKWVAGK